MVGPGVRAGRGQRVMNPKGGAKNVKLILEKARYHAGGGEQLDLKTGEMKRVTPPTPKTTARNIIKDARRLWTGHSWERAPLADVIAKLEEETGVAWHMAAALKILKARASTA